MPRCPHCNNEIERLDFTERVVGWESGYEDLPTGQGDREYTSGFEGDETISTDYSCPECNYEFSDEEIEHLNHEYERLNPSTTVRSNVTQQNIPSSLGTALQCPHCQHTYYDNKTEEMICPRCNETWSSTET